MQLVIAEKPSVARDLARVLGVRGWQNDRYAITWCVGHLVELDEPAAYDDRWRAWRLESLPMLPETFRLRASKHANDQLREVQRLLVDPRFRSVVNACDAGREGELIFRYVYQYAGCSLPIQRLWISSLTDEAIRRGFEQIRDGRDFEPLADAARSRSEADWLVGMNATRAITTRGRGDGDAPLQSIGRVQTPTLAMLVAREREIASFVPKPYWDVHGTFPGFVAKWRAGALGRVATVAIADAIVARDAAIVNAVVEKIRARVVREPPPMLFDLTALQATANRRFGLSAQRTLEIAQALYERHKVLTYPRTDSRHLSADVARELPSLFEALVELPELGRFARGLVESPPRPGRRIVDDTKVRDHHAIIPTGTLPRGLDRDEARVFDLVVRRFLGAFYPDAEFAATEAWLRVGDATRETPPFVALDTERFVDALPAMPDRYLARGRVRVVAGWQEVAGIEPRSSEREDRDLDPRERDDDAGGALPPLVEGQVLAGAYASVARQTTPPPRYTEASLLAAMESAGRRVTDEELRAAMRDSGLGTPATRAATIETLLRRGYIERGERKSIVATAAGIGLIDAIPASVASIASPELTGAWEARLARIARGEDARDAFMRDIARYTTEIVDAIRGSAAPGPSGPGPGSGSPPSSARVGARSGGSGSSPSAGQAAPSQSARQAATSRPAAASQSARQAATSPPASRPAAASQSARQAATSQPASRPVAASQLARQAATSQPASRPVAASQSARQAAVAASQSARQAATSPPTSRPVAASALWDGVVAAKRAIAELADRPATKRARKPRKAGGRRDAKASKPSQTKTKTALGVPAGDPRVRTTASPPTTRKARPNPARLGRAGQPGPQPFEPARANSSNEWDSMLAESSQRATRTSSKPHVLRADRGAVESHALAAAVLRLNDTPASLESRTCPRCERGTLLTGKRGWGCSRWKDGCAFVVWFETVRDLLAKGRGRLVLDPQGVRLATE